MFTGLIESVGRMVEREPTSGGACATFASSLAHELAAGDSIAVNGVCLTVTSSDRDVFKADLGPETLAVTTIGLLTSGALVNLERPLRPDARIGGHFVQGHVDAIGRIEALRREADFEWVTVSFPSDLAPFLVHKGSIAVDGISLTVARLAPGAFDVQIVPYTLDHTNLHAAKVGDRVNLETDMLGKYLVRLAELSGMSLEKERT